MRAVVSKEEIEVKAKAAETQGLADEAKTDLDQALPALNAALDSLNALNKGDIVEIKSMLTAAPCADDNGGVHCSWLCTH